MSLFFAYPNPFTKALIDEFEKLCVFSLSSISCLLISVVFFSPGT